MGSAVASSVKTVEIETKTCSRCQIEKPMAAFHRRSAGRGVRSGCKDCRRAARRTKPVYPSGKKGCPCCSQVKPLDQFYGREGGPKHSWCVDCESAQKKAIRAEEATRRGRRLDEEARAVVEAGKKICPKCGEVLSLDSFGEDRSRRDGHDRRCRVCVKLRGVELDDEDHERAHRWERNTRERKRRLARLAARGRPGHPARSEDTGEEEDGQATGGHCPPEVPE
jgi:hypothetical protein